MLYTAAQLSNHPIDLNILKGYIDSLPKDGDWLDENDEIFEDEIFDFTTLNGAVTEEDKNMLLSYLLKHPDLLMSIYRNNHGFIYYFPKDKRPYIKQKIEEIEDKRDIKESSLRVAYLYKKALFRQWSYSVPKDVVQQIYDFYGLSLMNPNAIDDPDFSASISDARTKITHKLWATMRNFLLRACLAEIIHFKPFYEGRKSLEKYNFEDRFIKIFSKITKALSGYPMDWGYEERYNKLIRILPYSDLLYFMKRAYSTHDLWEYKFGGKPWEMILNALEKLSNSPPPADQAFTFLDHVFDLEHNTGSVFTKISKDLSKRARAALDYKASSDPKGLYKKLSIELRKPFAAAMKDIYNISMTGSFKDKLLEDMKKDPFILEDKNNLPFHIQKEIFKHNPIYALLLPDLDESIKKEISEYPGNYLYVLVKEIYYKDKDIILKLFYKLPDIFSKILASDSSAYLMSMLGDKIMDIFNRMPEVFIEAFKRNHDVIDKVPKDIVFNLFNRIPEVFIEMFKRNPDTISYFPKDKKMDIFNRMSKVFIEIFKRNPIAISYFPKDKRMDIFNRIPESFAEGFKRNPNAIYHFPKDKRMDIFNRMPESFAEGFKSFIDAIYNFPEDKRPYIKQKIEEIEDKRDIKESSLRVAYLYKRAAISCSSFIH